MLNAYPLNVEVKTKLSVIDINSDYSQNLGGIAELIYTADDLKHRKSSNPISFSAQP